MHPITITEEDRQLILLALALMVVGPRPGFAYAAGIAAENLGGRAVYEYLKELHRPCRHERLNEEGVCRSCGADCRGIGS